MRNAEAPPERVTPRALLTKYKKGITIIKMDEKEIKQLLLNQVIYKANLSLKWLAEDMNKLTERINKVTLCLKDFSKQLKNSEVSLH